MAAKKSLTPIEKVFATYGRSEWVVEAGKVKELRLLKEVAEFAEEVIEDRDKEIRRLKNEACELRSIKWDKETMEVDLLEAQTEVKKYREDLQALRNKIYEILG